MTDSKLAVQKRELKGSKVKRLRREGVLPANIFGKDVDSLSVQTDLLTFVKVYEEAGETGIVNVTVEGETKARPVLISNVQTDPISARPVHADLYQIDLKEKVTANVPVELEGESPAEKKSDGTVVQLINEIEVEALPTDLPDSFVLDISVLEEVDQAIHVKDIKVDRDKVEIKIDGEEIVVRVAEPQEEEEEVEPVETEIIGEEKETKEGETETEESPTEEGEGESDKQ